MSVVHCWSAVVRRPSSVVPSSIVPSSVVRRPSSVVPLSVVRRPSSVVCRPLSVVRCLSFVVRHPSYVKSSVELSVAAAPFEMKGLLHVVSSAAPLPCIVCHPLVSRHPLALHHLPPPLVVLSTARLPLQTLPQFDCCIHPPLFAPGTFLMIHFFSGRGLIFYTNDQLPALGT